MRGKSSSRYKLEQITEKIEKNNDLIRRIGKDLEDVYKRQFVRLWISSLTDRAIREGLQHLRPGNEYDNLYLSAKARSEADWIVGINASQALAVAAGRGVWSLGRVQTPTLAIILSLIHIFSC